jgi:hypothetical protein
VGDLPGLKMNSNASKSLTWFPPASTIKAERSDTAVDLSDEDRFLLLLKGEQGLSWRDIAIRFQQS